MRIARAPAKLNLYLEILARRSDGFHELETFMVAIALCDSLSLTPTPAPPDGTAGDIVLDLRHGLSVRPPPVRYEIPTGTGNLVVQALQQLQGCSGCRSGAHIQLVKRIPAAAGLGGASSDAAAALRLANRAWQINWPHRRLAELAAEIGSDAPFFLTGRAALCRGRGERVTPIAPMRKLHFVVVKPPVELKTADVYAAHDLIDSKTARPAQGESAEVAAAFASNRGGEWKQRLHNRLQPAAAVLTPWVERLRAAFSGLDCLAHQLTGAGSAYFGICRHAQHARRVATLLRKQQLGLVYATRSYC
jgi:4-diphosphocytidyl-2-C-methyl-D-erythritol kinase